jgi:hypothetical protein
VSQELVLVLVLERSQSVSEEGPKISVVQCDLVRLFSVFYVVRSASIY